MKRTQAHLDPKPGETAGGFAETVANVANVGGVVVDDIVKNWGAAEGGWGVEGWVRKAKAAEGSPF